MLMFVVESGNTKTVGCKEKRRSVMGFQRDEHAEATMGFIITWFVAILLCLSLFNDCPWLVTRDVYGYSNRKLIKVQPFVKKLEFSLLTTSVHIWYSYLSMALQPFVEPWPLFQFDLFFYTVGRTPWTGEQPVARPLPAHRTAQAQNKRTQTSMPQIGFEPTTPVFQRAKTIHILDLSATVIGIWYA
jgi:hypothetical protein